MFRCNMSSRIKMIKYIFLFFRYKNKYIKKDSDVLLNPFIYLLCCVVETSNSFSKLQLYNRENCIVLLQDKVNSTIYAFTFNGIFSETPKTSFLIHFIILYLFIYLSLNSIQKLFH